MEAITRTKVPRTETFPKRNRCNRGEGVDSAPDDNFCAASEGDSAKQNKKGDSAKKDECNQEVDLYAISGATVRDKTRGGSCRGDTPECGQESLGGSQRLNTGLHLNRVHALHIKCRTSKDSSCVR